MERYEFEAKIKKHPDLNATYIEFPYNVEEEFGTRGQVKVQVTFDGHRYQGSLAPMGGEFHLLALVQKIRKAINKEPGDLVSVVLQQDTNPRTVNIPPDLLLWLEKNPKEREFFENLSFTNRKEYVRWIAEARKEETRTFRLNKTFSLLKDQVKHP